MATSRTVRWSWLTVGTILAIASIGWAAFNVASLFAWDRQRFETTFRVAQRDGVRTVDIDNDGGSVHVIGTEGEDVIVNGEIVQGFQKASHAERVEGDRVVLEGDCPLSVSYCNIDYEVQVPRDVDIRVRASGGPVTVTGVDGDLDIGSSGGGIRVEGGGGDLLLRSSGGGVRAFALTATRVDASSSGGGVQVEFVDAPRTVVAHSSGGGVTVVVPDIPSVFYGVDASSSGGSVDTDIRSDPTSDRTISARSSAGGVTVRYPE
jgi:hypothetical protein